MKRKYRKFLLAMVIQVVVGAALSPSASAQNIPVGEVRSVIEFADDVVPAPTPTGFAYVTTPEGIASDRQGNLYVGNRSFTPGGIVSVIVKISPDGTATTIAELPTADFSATGVLGLAVDPGGEIYAAHNTNTADRGVYRISSDGSQVDRLAGSEAMIFPNALTFDARGNLYATDSIGGAIWRFPKDGGQGSLWLEDSTFEPAPPDPATGPLPGANGIAFFPPNHLYVANTSKFTISRVDIEPKGNPSLVPWPIAIVPFPDGIAMDALGDIYVVVPPGLVFGLSPVVKVNSQTGTVSDIVIGLDGLKINFPLSLAFGQGKRNQKSVYVTSSGLFGPIPGFPQPGIVEVGVGEPGFKGR